MLANLAATTVLIPNTTCLDPNPVIRLAERIREVPLSGVESRGYGSFCQPFSKRTAVTWPVIVCTSNMTLTCSTNLHRFVQPWLPLRDSDVLRSTHLIRGPESSCISKSWHWGPRTGRYRKVVDQLNPRVILHRRPWCASKSTDRV